MPEPTKGKLPKAYLRLDPNIDQTHTDPGAMVRLLCAANRQPHRGRFKSRTLMEAVLGKATVKDAIDRRDVVEQPDGRYYVPGWDEWQEGDWTVGERQKRIRARRNAGNVTESRPDSDTDTPPPSPDRISTPKALGSKAARQQGVLADAPRATDDRYGLPHITDVSKDVAESITGMGILSAGEKQLTEWDRLVEFHGEAKVAEAFRAVAGGKRITYRQLVWDTVKHLEPFAKPTAIEEKRKDQESSADWEARIAATRRETDWIRRHMYPEEADDAA